MSRFRFPDGVDFGGDDGAGNVSFSVSIPADEDGHIGRQCPECDRLFRMSVDDYDELPDELELWCVYCGMKDEHSEFLTDQQEERAMRAAGDYAQQLVGQMLDDTFGRMARRSQGSMISISYRSKPFFPTPLPDIDEEALIRQRVCSSCDVRYAVFGEHRFCPACGPLAPLAVAEDALAAEVTRLDALSDLPEEVTASLKEQGVLDKTYVDTIENLVGIVETLADAIFRSAVPDAGQVLRRRGNVFQRLEDSADLFDEHAGVDLREAMRDAWRVLLETWAARHVFVHNDGVVDEKYLLAVPDSPLREGQRLRFTEQQTRAAIALVEQMCGTIASAKE
jgi:hypothetical protein